MHSSNSFNTFKNIQKRHSVCRILRVCQWFDGPVLDPIVLLQMFTQWIHWYAVKTKTIKAIDSIVQDKVTILNTFLWSTSKNPFKNIWKSDNCNGHISNKNSFYFFWWMVCAGQFSKKKKKSIQFNYSKHWNGQFLVTITLTFEGF